MRGILNVLVWFTLILFLNCGIADLRNDILKTQPVPQEIQDIARSLLKNPPNEMLSPELWRGTQGLDLFLIDYWDSTFVRFFTPVPEKVQAMRARISLVRNTIHIRFTDGRKKGKTFGVEDGEAYVYDPKTGRVFTKDSDIQTYSESLRLYLILPLVVHSFPKLAHLGSVGIGDKEYHEIFATKGDWEVSEMYDQYRIYVHKDSGRIDYVQFTYRDVFSFYKGILRYEEYTPYQGRLYPIQISIQDDFHSEKFIHQLQIGTIRFLSQEPVWED